MKFTYLQPFVPSGPDFEKSKQLFLALGFDMVWDAGGYAGFSKEGCKFILQQFDNSEFAENFMVSVGVTDVAAFRTMVLEKKLPEKFGIKVGDVSQQPYGKEVTLIDIAGVCWHFVEA